MYPYRLLQPSFLIFKARHVALAIHGHRAVRGCPATGQVGTGSQDPSVVPGARSFWYIHALRGSDPRTAG